MLAEVDALRRRYGVTRTTALGLAVGLSLRSGALEGALRQAEAIGAGRKSTEGA